MNEVIYFPEDQTLSGLQNEKDWLTANHVAVTTNTPEGGKVQYRIAPVGDIAGGYFSRGDLRAAGSALKCDTNTNSSCLYPTGAYAWNTYHGLDDMGGSRGRISGSGLLMPLKWTVEGTIFDQ